MSKFKGGLEAYKQRTSENTDQVNQKESTTIENNSLTITNNQDSNNSSVINTIALNSDKDKTNRKESKEYQQVNAYVPKQLYKKVKIALIEEERGISDLITELLANWINKRTKQ
ncbi:MAG: hypothetical protein FD167_863 [bacterium]|nr:MAG: hypothetical protein FD167_863 [bacterium]